MGRAPRLISSTWSPSRKTRVRKPSHLGSYSQLSPFGIPASEGAESIGSMSWGMGNFMPVVHRCLYLVDGGTPCYHIGGREDGPEFDSTPPPQPWEARASGLPAFYGSLA